MVLSNACPNVKKGADVSRNGNMDRQCVVVAHAFIPYSLFEEIFVTVALP
jgi:hypothetical protein